MGAWVTGHNIAGYLPESDTYAFESRDDAVEQLKIDMRRYADTDDDAAYEENQERYANGQEVLDDEHPAMLATVGAILTDDGPDAPGLAGKDWSAGVEDNDGRMIVFWVMWNDDREEGDDERVNP